MRDMLNTEHLWAPPVHHDSGFTLLEVMVSIAIIAIVLVSIMRLQGQTVGMNESFRFYTQASLLANARMSEVLTDSDGAGGPSSGDFDEAFAGYAWQVERETVIIDIPDGDEIELEKITVTITLDNGRMNYQLDRFRAPFPEL
jgi:general secretion pathway protein I